MKKEPQNNKNDADEQTTLSGEFSKYTPSIFDLPTIDDLLGSDDKKSVILADVNFEQTGFGEQAVILLADGLEYHTGSEVMVKKFHTAYKNGIEYPKQAWIVRKGIGNKTYFDIV